VGVNHAAVLVHLLLVVVNVVLVLALLSFSFGWIRKDGVAVTLVFLALVRAKLFGGVEPFLPLSLSNFAWYMITIQFVGKSVPDGFVSESSSAAQ
jgi:hypothetical protein